MSVRVMSWVWEHSRSRKTERLVLLAIADCASDDGSNAYPSNSELQRKTGLSERGVQRALTNLVGLGELFVGRNTGPRGCNLYRVIMHTPVRDAPRTNDGGVSGAGAGNAPPANGAPAEMTPPVKTAPEPPSKTTGDPVNGAPGTVQEPSVEPSDKKTSSSKRGTRLPDDFAATPEMVAWARANTPGVGARETDAFIDYWRAQPGQRGVKTDWPATWRNWMRRAQEDLERRGRKPTHASYRNPTDPAAYHGDL
jgi:hypothetical protein